MGKRGRVRRYKKNYFKGIVVIETVKKLRKRGIFGKRLMEKTFRFIRNAS